jgi:antitoxin ParD1/3/4
MVAKVQKISIALPKEMVADIRHAVDSGRYATTSEVVRQAVREWTERYPPGYPMVRTHDDLKRMAQEGLKSARTGKLIPAEQVFDRLEKKYAALAKAQAAKKRKR